MKLTMKLEERDRLREEVSKSPVKLLGLVNPGKVATLVDEPNLGLWDFLLEHECLCDGLIVLVAIQDQGWTTDCIGFL